MARCWTTCGRIHLLNAALSLPGTPIIYYGVRSLVDNIYSAIATECAPMQWRPTQRRILTPIRKPLSAVIIDRRSLRAGTSKRIRGRRFSSGDEAPNRHARDIAPSGAAIAFLHPGIENPGIVRRFRTNYLVVAICRAVAVLRARPPALPGMVVVELSGGPLSRASRPPVLP